MRFEQGGEALSVAQVKDDARGARQAGLDFPTPRSEDELDHATTTRRLARWAELLEREPKRMLNTLRETEYLEPAWRDRARADGSALAVAYDDAMLRDDGLAGDTYGAVKRFFGLDDERMHRVLCLCMYGRHAPSKLVAKRLRQIGRAEARKAAYARVVRALLGRWAPRPGALGLAARRA